MELIYKEEFFKIKKACIEVKNILGNGFLEKVYENALCLSLKDAGFSVERQKNIKIKYKGTIVGDYYADIVVNNKIIIEMKATEKIKGIHKAQLLNYLKATGYKLGILINFSNKSLGFEIERVPNLIID